MNRFSTLTASMMQRFELIVMILSITGLVLVLSLQSNQALAQEQAPSDPSPKFEAKPGNWCAYVVFQTNTHCPSWKTNQDTFCTNCPNTISGSIKCKRRATVTIPGTMCVLTGERLGIDCARCTPSHTTP